MSWRPVALALTLLLPGLAVAETPPQSPAGGQAGIELARGYRHATVIEGGQSYRIGQGETCATATGRPPPSLDPRRLDECSLYRDPVSP